MERKHERVLVTTDERTAHLYRCAPDESGRWTLELRDSLRNTEEDSHEHHRPTQLGRGPAGTSPHTVTPAHEHEEERQRFAHEVVGWLSTHADPDSHPLVFAPPRFLGELRSQEARLSHGIELHPGELCGLGPKQLARQPAVIEALNAAVHAG